MEQDGNRYYVRNGRTWALVHTSRGHFDHEPLTWEQAVQVAGRQTRATGEPFHVVPMGSQGAAGVTVRVGEAIELRDLRGREWDNPLRSELELA